MSSGVNDDNANKSKSSINKKTSRVYRKGTKYGDYSLQDKAKVIELAEQGTKNCDIVRMTGMPDTFSFNILYLV